MSFCPSKDIHSIYLDNEMPSEFKKDYEAHLNSCPKCQKELARLKAVHNLFEKDCNSIQLDQKFMDESFERLQLKLKFSKNTSKSTAPRFNSKFIYAVSAAAAAGVFALVVPLRYSGNSVKKSVQPSQVSVAPSYANKASAVSLGGTGKGMVISGNIHATTLSSPKGTSVHNISSSEMAKTLIKDVDIIRPDLGEKSISIRITVPGMESVPFEAEVTFPKDVTSVFGE